MKTCCTFGLSMFLIACGGSKPEEVAKNYVQAAYDGDSKEMLSYIYIPENYKNKPGAEEMINGKIQAGAAKAKENAERKGGVKKIEITRQEIDEANGKGRVEVTTEFKNEGARIESDTVKLIRNDDKWKINL